MLSYQVILILFFSSFFSHFSSLIFSHYSFLLPISTDSKVGWSLASSNLIKISLILRLHEFSAIFFYFILFSLVTFSRTFFDFIHRKMIHSFLPSFDLFFSLWIKLHVISFFLFYFILFHFIILFYSILLYFILFYFILFYFILFYFRPTISQVVRTSVRYRLKQYC